MPGGRISILVLEREVILSAWPARDSPHGPLLVNANGYC